MTRYPRDMRGYGPTPPDPHWPAQAKIAISMVLNYEEGGENNILHGDAASEAFLSDIAGAAMWPGQRHWNMESVYEYGARAGFWRLHRLFSRYDIPVTIFGVGSALARNPEQLEAMKAAGWEIASHGLKWIEHKDMTEAEERTQIQEAIRLHTELTGSPPSGWYTGRCSENTVRLTSETQSFKWISDTYDDDLPYWRRFGDHDQLVIPYTLEANDMRFATAPGYIDGEQFFRYLKDSFDTLYQEGVEGMPKMLSVGLHNRLIGRPGKIAGLKRFVEYARSHSDVWFATRGEIADHWMATHPPRDKKRPSQMKRAEFVETFASIYEHSEWIAERAFALELGPAHDCTAGMFSALARVFRSASRAERLAVLRAHPDLAGKLAQAERLTRESQSEQASAGLNLLTDEERARFEELNKQYTDKFGFPFIIAVKDHNKAGILDAFTRRLSNTTAAEFDESCRQVERIAWHRLSAMDL
ncbi:allantoinase PuuE [Rhodobacteraceae bacterium]|nr:allantoinase PuuE [Paracoccaceae bacterium]